MYRAGQIVFELCLVLYDQIRGGFVFINSSVRPCADNLTSWKFSVHICIYYIVNITHTDPVSLNTPHILYTFKATNTDENKVPN
jgi:hypothetical protein